MVVIAIFRVIKAPFIDGNLSIIDCYAEAVHVFRNFVHVIKNRLVGAPVHVIEKTVHVHENCCSRVLRILTNGFVTPTDVFLGFLYRKKLLELLLRNELSIGPVPGLTLERGEGLLKGARESNGTVIKQAADLNARVNAGTLLLGIPAIAVGADIDTTGRVLTGHQ